MDKQRYKRLEELAVLMRRQGSMRLPINRQLIDLFDQVITDEEAVFLLRMGRDYVTRQQAATQSGLTDAQFDPLFDELIGKGLLHIRTRSDGSGEHEEEFAPAAFLVGWFEKQMIKGEDNEKTRAFAWGMERLFDSYRKMNFFPIRPLVNYLFRKKSHPYQSVALATPTPGSKKRVTINRPIEADPQSVSPANSVMELVEKYGDDNIALLHCFCRYWKRAVGDPCRFKMPEEACIVIGDEAKHCVKYGFGRLISKEEALEVITKVQKRGGIHTMFHERDRTDRPEIAICNCCWDCCGLWSAYNRGVGPLHMKAHYQARITDPAACKGCERCQELCPTAAITVEGNHSTIKAERCIGCGVCAFHCQRDVISMDPGERDVVLPLQKKGECRL